MKSVKEILKLQEKTLSRTVSGSQYFEPYEDIFHMIKDHFSPKTLDELGKIWNVDEFEIDFEMPRDVDAGPGDIELENVVTNDNKKFKDVESLLKDTFNYCLANSEGILKHELELFIAKNLNKVAYNYEEYVQEFVFDKAASGDYQFDDEDDYSTGRNGVTN